MDRGQSRTARRGQHIPFKLMTSLIFAMGFQVMMMSDGRNSRDALAAGGAGSAVRLQECRGAACGVVVGRGLHDLCGWN